MKIIHTGDWHIGKIILGLHLTEDQRYILHQFTQFVKEEKPDVIIIAGDLYDRSVPPVEAVELLDDVFYEIVGNLNIPIVAISGNHDSGDRVSFGGRLLNTSKLYIEGRIKKCIEPVVIEDKFGPVNFYLVPYADPAMVRNVYEDDNIHTHDDAMKAIITGIKQTLNRDERNVLVTHGFVVGKEKPETCDSERPMSIGGTDAVNVEYFKDFNYVALGHLHGQQRVGSDNIRYSGSLMKYSFSEARQKKSITIVDIDKKGEVSFTLKELHAIRDMRVIKGKLKDLLLPEVYADTNTEDYLNVELTDEGELIEPMSKLRTVYPNVLSLTRKQQNENIDSKTSASENFNKKSKLELFKEFYTNITGREFNSEKVNVMKEAIEKAEKEG